MLDYIRFLYYKRKFKKLQENHPHLFLNIRDTASVANTPLKVYALCEALISVDMKPNLERRSPEEVNFYFKATPYEKVEFMASLLRHNKFRLNIVSIGRNAREAEKAPIHYFVVVRAGKKYISMGETYMKHRGNMIDMVKDFMPKGSEIPTFLIYDYTGDEMVASYISGSETPFRIKEDYDPRRDIA